MRVGENLTLGRRLPAEFENEVHEKLSMVTEEDADLSNEYLCPDIFTRLHDQQLLTWMNRYDIASMHIIIL